MGFFKKLSSFFTPPSQVEEWSYWITARCNRCGEIIRSRVDLRNDLSIQYGETSRDTTYYTRKILIGEGRCYQQVEVELTFDASRKLVDRKIRGGTFVDDPTGSR